MARLSADMRKRCMAPTEERLYAFHRYTFYESQYFQQHTVENNVGLWTILICFKKKQPCSSRKLQNTTSGPIPR